MHLAPMILLVDDDEAILSALGMLLKKAGYLVQTASRPEEAWPLIRQKAPELVLADMNFSRETSGEEGLAFLKALKQQMPQVPVILITAWGSIDLAVEGMKLGAADFISKPWQNEHLLRSVKTVLELARQEEPSGNSRSALNQRYDFDAIVGEDPGLLRVLETVGKVSATDASILITGESGTGKELIAEAIHLNSKRYNQPFVKVNLGGISSSLFESEMFGHKKGAFTDAREDRVGRFALAEGGTIFLDEIGELDLNSQVKLLRVLQDRTYEVLGDSKSRNLNVRVICATNRNLEKMVAEGSFREDLFYRINLISVRLPALRERANDIPRLVQQFVANMKHMYGRQQLEISEEALQWLKNQPFHGNIRELKNLVERCVLLSSDELLQITDFQQYMGKTDSKQPDNLPLIPLETMERALIIQAMQQYPDNLSQVARVLGLSRGALYRRLEKFSIPYEAPR